MSEPERPIPDLHEQITLRDGRTVEIRAIVPEDAPRLRALHARLSPQSIYQRFFGQLHELSPEEAARLAVVDYQSRMAIVATVGEADEEQIVAVARYAADPERDPGAAEVAIVVEDPYQGLGLGTALLLRLTQYGLKAGIRELLASVRHDNDQILRFVVKSGLPTKRSLESGVWEIRVHLRDEHGNPLPLSVPPAA